MAMSLGPLGLGLTSPLVGSRGSFDPLDLFADPGDGFPSDAMLADFEGSQFFWAGASKVLGDLTSTPNGYTLANVSWRTSAATTYIIDYETDPAASAASYPFALDNNGTVRIEFELQSLAGGSVNILRLYNNPPGSNYNASNTYTAGQAGRQRFCVVAREGQPAIIGLNGNTVVTTGSNIGVTTAINRASFFYRARFNDGVTTATKLAVRAFPRALSATEVEAVMAQGDEPPVHLIGDSFLNSNSLSNEVRLDLTDTYRMWSQDGVGGSTLVEQAARFALTPRYWDSTLVIMDGGLSDTSAEAIAAIADMVSRLSHDRWFYMEPGYGTDQIAGSANRIAQDAKVAAIKAAYPGHFVPTLDAIQALNDGSPEDLDDVNVSDIWPRSLRSDALHPGTVVNGAGHSGVSGLGGLIADAVRLPFSLFDGGIAGGLYDPSVLSSLWQDSARTVPVTADGDPVGCMDDLSGNANHLLQIGAATTRPTYRTSGGLHWLEGDGTADYLRATFTLTQTFERISALRQITWTLNDQIFGGSAANAGVLFQITGTPNIALFDGSIAVTNAGAAVGADVVVTERHAGASSQMAVNNVAYVTGNPGTTGPGGVTLFASNGGAGNSNVRCYGFIIRAGTMNDSEISFLRTYFGAKAGLAL
ncbi:MAG: hypothetical protein EOS10_00110 [Mesorhizobium sp.]|uniref:hypothetical protein n=1 Tax=Mesorhizobium sp. TaxID=1871066 RepID=UPI000FE959D4|nr:hypothetical protein [Mesorhizobium sp.]RWO34742.1 MAG: hypothetical protein EOS10_00110 [Mesorhizobium sp.]